MPKLPVVSGKDTINALERLGFSVTRQKGSHVVLRKGNIRQAGLSVDEFIEAL